HPIDMRRNASAERTMATRPRRVLGPCSCGRPVDLVPLVVAGGSWRRRVTDPSRFTGPLPAEPDAVFVVPAGHRLGRRPRLAVVRGQTAGPVRERLTSLQALGDPAGPGEQAV